jgi:hypothetical protein
VIQIQKSLNALDPHVYSEGKPMLDEIFFDVKKLSYKVKDYQ